MITDKEFIALLDIALEQVAEFESACEAVSISLKERHEAAVSH